MVQLVPVLVLSRVSNVLWQHGSAIHQRLGYSPAFTL